MSRKRGALLGEQTELQASLQQAQTELREQEVAIATREGEFNALQNSNRLLHQKIETVVFEIQSLAAQEQEGSQKRNALAAQLNELETRERAGQEQVAALTAELENLRQQRDAANAALTESKVALAAEEQLLASFRQQQQSLGTAHSRADPGGRAAAQRSFIVYRPQGAGGIGNPGFAVANRAFAARARAGERANRRIAGAETIAGSRRDHARGKFARTAAAG